MKKHSFRRFCVGMLAPSRNIIQYNTIAKIGINCQSEKAEKLNILKISILFKENPYLCSV